MSSPIRDAVARGLEPGADLAAAIHEAGDPALADPADARAVCEALERMPPEPPGDSATRSPMHAVLGLLQSVETREAYDVIVDRGLPRLAAIVDGWLAADAPDDRRGVGLFALKVLGLYRVPEAIGRIADAARRPGWRDDPLWEVVFRTFDQRHPLRLSLCDRLRDPLPGGLAGVAYLGFANDLAREGFIDDHPFDTPEGRGRLLDLLRAPDPDPAARALAARAAAALPFIAVPDREQLLALAMDHAAPEVQLEGRRAAAKLGSEAGVQFLSRMCLDLRHGIEARVALQELERHDAVPARACEPNFEAMAKMVDWLSHPMEYGRAPDEISLYDTRELLWPPTSDVRRLWLFRYRYEPADPGRPAAEGVGLVGSITFALAGSTSPAMPPEDVYALHCCWELKVDDDPRAPAELDVGTGRRLLGLPG